MFLSAGVVCGRPGFAEETNLDLLEGFVFFAQGFNGVFVSSVF